MSPFRLHPTRDAADKSRSALLAQIAAPMALKLQFLASLNHELRTPLSGILGMADLLLETNLDSDQLEYVNAARQCAESLCELLNEALEYTTVATGVVNLDEAEFHVFDTLQGAILESERKITPRGFTLACHHSTTLPRTAIGDAHRIGQALSALIVQATRISLEGAIEVKLSSASSSQNELALEITIDTPSTCVAPDHVRSLVESFENPDASSQHRFNVINLGFALCSRLIRLLNGELHFSTSARSGAYIVARIPMRTPRPVIVQTIPGRVPKIHDGSKRILVVDDNRISRQVLSAVLAKGAFEVDCVCDGSEALSAAMAQTFDLILMDLNMPGLSGFETTALLRQQPGYEAVPVLALTAEVGDHVRNQCLAQGMAAYIEKPINAPELLATIRGCLERM